MIRRIFISISSKPQIFSTNLRVPSHYFSSDKAVEVQTVKKVEKKKDIQQYKDGQLTNKSALILKKQEDIEGYVFTMIKNYFRTTNKGGLTMDSDLLKHGLDSLDTIELAMQVEEDLGYVISAETLPVLNKVKHFVNYIKHVEQFKQENAKDPLA